MDNSLGVGHPMTAAAKRATRAELQTRRRSLSTVDVAAAGDALTRQLASLTELAASRHIAAYWPLGSEPSTIGAIQAFADRGTAVLLPLGRTDGDLDWGRFISAAGLEPGQAGFAEPTSERLGPDTLAGVDAVLVPALAVDLTGGRLGRGSGAYDRALARVPAGIPIIAVVFDSEVIDDVPMEPHDRRVTMIVTPDRVLRVR